MIVVDEPAYSVHMMHELGRATPEYDGRLQQKCAEVHMRASEFDALFSDYAKGDPAVTFRMFFDPRSVWFEMIEDDQQIGVLYLTDLNPFWDAQAHLAFWDRRFRGREDMLWAMISFVMSRYELHRLSAEIPRNQRMYVRWVQRLGFVFEGLRREGTIKDGEWIHMVMLGLLPADAERARRIWAAKRGAERHLISSVA